MGRESARRFSALFCVRKAIQKFSRLRAKNLRFQLIKIMDHAEPIALILLGFFHKCTPYFPASFRVSR